MKVETKYICEQCGEKYDNRDNALSCEERGIPNNNIFPLGLMWICKPGIGCGDCIGGVEPIFIFSIKEIRVEDRSHYLSMSAYACRNNIHGDNLEHGSVGFQYILKDFFKDKEEIDDLLRPEVQRMVNYLRSKGITPSYFKNGTLIEYTG